MAKKLSPNSVTDIFRATFIAEGVYEVDTEEEYFAAWQLLVDTGTCWKLQGWFGRTARELIDAGKVNEALHT